MNSAEFAGLTLEEAAQRARSRDVSAHELCAAALARCYETEPAVRAFVVIDDVRALAVARAADRMRPEEISRRPLHGLPVAVKDVFGTSDLPTEAGCRALRGHLTHSDSAAVATLRRAGAIVIGKTVTQELAYGQDTPVTRNAADPRRLPGGSSAGSAVAVGAGSVLAALGTDGGGSVRVPAALNGVVGLKPTFGFIDRMGVITGSPTLDHVGLLTRTVGDCEVLLDALVPAQREPPPQDAKHVRIGVTRAALRQPTPAVQAQLVAAEALFHELGATLVEVQLAAAERALAAGLTITLAEVSALYGGLLRRAPDDITVGTRVMLQLGELLPATVYLRALAERDAIIAELEGLFATFDLDAVFAPAVLEYAPLAPARSPRSMWEARDDSVLKLLSLHMWCNVAGLPSISIPCRPAAELPTGFQLVGRRGSDRRLLQIATLFESASSR